MVSAGNAGLTHRLRGHQLRKESRYIDSDSERAKSFYRALGIESGRVDHMLVCSCGAEWLLTLTDPLRSEWKWFRQ